jgi:hypothetical protein
MGLFAITLHLDYAMRDLFQIELHEMENRFESMLAPQTQRFDCSNQTFPFRQYQYYTQFERLAVLTANNPLPLRVGSK